MNYSPRRDPIIRLVSIFLCSWMLFTTSCAQESPVYDFNQSAGIVMDLLLKGRLGEILESHDPEQLDTLIKNFSPAGMAFESEVLSCTLPVIMYFFSPEDIGKTATSIFTEQLARDYSSRIKIVAIDAQKFFSIAQALNVEETPTFVTIHNRQVVELLKGKDSISKIIGMIYALSNCSNNQVLE